jgi:hypothetical protein
VFDFAFIVLNIEKNERMRIDKPKIGNRAQRSCNPWTLSGPTPEKRCSRRLGFRAAPMDENRTYKALRASGPGSTLFLKH